MTEPNTPEINSPICKYFLTVALSIIVSLAGTIWAAFHDPADGGRGGAVAVAISFYVLFVRKDIGAEVEKEKLKEIDQKNSPLENTEIEIKGMRARLNANTNGQEKQNCYLMVASITGTLFWGFGDLLACSIKNYFHL